MTHDERQIRKLMDEWRRRTLEGDANLMAAAQS